VAGPLPGGAPLRFVDLTDAYSARLRELARSVDPDLAEGVYAGLGGPHYETPAEIRMLRTLGADLVGMSTVWEAIAARHLGAEVLALSLVTNLAAGLSGAPLDHEEVLEAGRRSAERMGGLLAEVVDRL
jgi:purine-nucleoside phosphorylase